jgi:acyl-CoA hydrolase
MSWVDIAGAICAQRHSQKQVVTAHVDELTFVAPVYKGWVVNLKASVNYTGRTSMEVGVRVDAENPTTNEKFHTASAYLTFVGLNAHGDPTPIPPILPETEDEVRRNRAARARRDHRLQIREQLKKQNAK